MSKFKIIALLLILSSKVFSQSIEQTDSITLTFIGDIMGHTSQINAAYDSKTKTYDYNPVFEKMPDAVRNSDFAIGNLEVTLAGKPYTGYPQFSSPDELAVACKNNGIDVLVTANNHSCDKGKKGVLRTIKVLDSLDIKHTGTFTDSSDREKNNLLVLEKNNIKVGILNYTFSTNQIPTPKPTFVNRIDKSLMLADIEKSKKDSLDKLIVFIHWGNEYKNHPGQSQTRIAKFLFDNGVDIIIGAHPHVLQKIEFKEDKFIAYSLGNFVSAQRTSGRDGGAIVELTISKKDEKAYISNYGYHLTWVHKFIENKQYKYEILACSELESNEFDGLSSNSKVKMKRFTTAARALLKKENILVGEMVTKADESLMLKEISDNTVVKK